MARDGFQKVAVESKRWSVEGWVPSKNLSPAPSPFDVGGFGHGGGWGGTNAIRMAKGWTLVFSRIFR